MSVRRILWVAVALLIVVVGVAWVLRPERPQLVTGAMVGRPVPDFGLPGLDATHPGLSVTDLRQGSVTVVNLFASWCLPCRLEAPQLKTLADRGVIVHGIAIADKSLDIDKFLSKNGNPYRRIGLDPDRRVSAAFRSTGVPETYVISGQGVVLVQRSGPLRPEDIAPLLAEIKGADR